MTAPAPEAEAEPPKKSPMPFVIAAVALLAGLGVGAKVVGPMVKGKKAPAAAGAEKADEGKAADLKVFDLNNIIVNPAGTMGSRYLIMSASFEVPDDISEEKLKRNEVALRDAITAVLEKETLESLGRTGAREGFKPVLEEVAHRYIPGVKVRVYIPQFLIQ